MGGGRKRKQAGNQHTDASKMKKKPGQPKPEALESWITNLAKQSVDPSGTTSTSTKEERQEKRAAKKQRRLRQIQEKQQQNQGLKSGASSKNQEILGASSDKSNQKRRLNSTTTTTTTTTQKRLRLLTKECKEAVHRQPKRQRPFQGFNDDESKRKRNNRGKQKKWNIQPKPNDYGGLGLALPSLFLSLEDPSFSRRLEDEFQEHIDGFFGKQRTKAMKKQLDGQMLWRQMQRSKLPQQSAKNDNKHNKKKGLPINGEKLASMTPDQRVEAMLKAGML